MDTHPQQHQQEDSSTSKDTQGRRTRSKTGSLPTGSRNQTVFDNLAQGLSSAGPSRPSSRRGATTQGDIPEETQPLEKANIQPHRLSHRELDKIQQVCASESQPIRQDIVSIQERINTLHSDPTGNPGVNQSDIDGIRHQQQQLQESQDTFQMEQKKQMDTLLPSLRPIEDVKQLVQEVATLRHDTNQLMENQSEVKVPRDIPASAPEVDTVLDKALKSLQSKLDDLHTANSAIPREQPRVMPVQVGIPPAHEIHGLAQQQLPRQEIRHGNPGASSDDEFGYPNHQQQYADDSDDEDMANIAFFSRPKGPRYLDLMAIRPADPLFDRLMNYRYYRLLRCDHHRDTQTMLDANTRIKSLMISLGDFKFSGQDPILIFDFLTRITEEADINQMTEAQAFVALPRFLSGFAEVQFRSTRSGSCTGGVRCWPEAVQYLLSTYATPAAIRQAVQQVLDTKQNPGEDEMDYSMRLNHAIHRCGNVHEETQKLTYFINGLSPEIHSIVAGHRENTPRYLMRYERLVQFARDEGQALRARSGIHRQPQGRKSVGPPRKATVQYLNEGSPIKTEDHPPGIHLLDDMEHQHTSIPTSVATSNLPSTELSGYPDNTDAEGLLYTSVVKPQ